MSAFFIPTVSFQKQQQLKEQMMKKKKSSKSRKDEDRPRPHFGRNSTSSTDVSSSSLYSLTSPVSDHNSIFTGKASSRHSLERAETVESHDSFDQKSHVTLGNLSISSKKSANKMSLKALATSGQRSPIMNYTHTSDINEILRYSEKERKRRNHSVRGTYPSPKSSMEGDTNSEFGRISHSEYIEEETEKEVEMEGTRQEEKEGQESIKEKVTTSDTSSLQLEPVYSDVSSIFSTRSHRSIKKSIDGKGFAAKLHKMVK
ncbi:hypothetical protein CAAN1_11S02982 [[Candida] anglica]|uniref:Uncharacterized protein n=1 Tax=[Candida] anglica TaxID=148631 RepID=A0ABP0EHZ8_9ASCO